MAHILIALCHVTLFQNYLKHIVGISIHKLLVTYPNMDIYLQ